MHYRTTFLTNNISYQEQHHIKLPKKQQNSASSYFPSQLMLFKTSPPLRSHLQAQCHKNIFQDHNPINLWLTLQIPILSIQQCLQEAAPPWEVHMFTP